MLLVVDLLIVIVVLDVVSVNGDVVTVDAVVIVVVHVVVVVVDVVPVACICRRRCCAFINICFRMADIFLLTKRVFFFSFISLFLSLTFFFYWGGPRLFVIKLYEFRLNGFDPSTVVDHPCAPVSESGRKIERDREDPRLQCFFSFFFWAISRNFLDVQ